MADLIDRLAGIDFETRPAIDPHDFVGALRNYTAGKRTRAQAIAGFDLQGDELNQANQLADAMDAKSNTLAKLVFLEVIAGVISAIQGKRDPLIWPDGGAGAINKAQVAADLEL